MKFKDWFMQEQQTLRELGDDFVEDDPRLAPFLGRTASDPASEYLMEHFAFLTARLVMKIEDHLPELTHPLLQLLYPNFLRPLPSMALMQFQPVDHALSETQVLPKGTPVFSRAVDGVSCEFRTCAEGTEHYDHVEQLHAHVKNMIHGMVEQVRQLEHCDEGDRVVFSYCLCCVVDEAVMTTSWGRDSSWKAQSLLSAIHQETWGGEKFFSVLERLLDAPEKRYDLFVFLFWCLALGYRGKYANQTNGDKELAAWLKQVHDRIVELHGPEAESQRLTDPLTHVAPRHYRMNRQLPWWTPWAVMGVFCTGLYLYFTTKLDGISQQVLASLQATLQP